VIVSSVTFDRASLALADLVASNDPDDALFLSENGIVRPDFDYRRGYAPQSSFSPGQQLLSAVLEASTLSLVIMCRATSTALLRAAEAELTAAVGQFAFDVTLTVDGQAETWAADCSVPKFGDVDSGMAKAFLSRAVLTIPINP
jgi:hypothetical protein